ncbi:MAG: GNAT family N-acetyltransferase [Bacteroidia bacterium]
MKFIIETERLILREILPSDEDGLFKLDSDPEVHRYFGNKPVENKDQVKEVIQFIRGQYVTNGIGRWAVIEKGSNNFIGWCGLKLHTETVNDHIHFYDLGYRLIKKHWGKGYGTESAKACLKYGFEQMDLKEIYAMIDTENEASRKVLQKLGFKFIEHFDYDGDPSDWLKITKED